MNTILKTFALLTPKERRQVYWLLLGIVFVALFQVAGIASITPFLALVTDPDTVNSDETINWLYRTLPFEDQGRFTFFIGILVLLIITIGNSLSMLMEWLMLRFSWLRNHDLSLRLLKNYMAQPYTFFLGRNSADLGKNMLSEVQEVIQGILVPSMSMLANIVVATFIMGLLIFINPVLAFTVLAVLGGAYLLIFSIVKRRLARLGSERVESNRYRFQTANEAVSGIKDIKLLGKETYFLERYAKASRRFSSHIALSEAIGQTPRYALEIIAFGGIIIIVLYQLAVNQGASDVIPIAGLYAFAGYRLMPALQQIYKTIAKSRFILAALEAVHEDISMTRERGLEEENRDALEPLPFKKELRLSHLSYQYPGAKTSVFEDLDLSIGANTSVAFVGATGSGKTTTVDLILGLLKPDAGTISVDGVALTEDLIPRWQKNLGYVPQHIYLSDDTIKYNIAFGIPKDQVDDGAVKRAAKVAQLHDFIVSELPQQYDTFVGERGVRLSGGQRQRIGIARALYHNPDILIFDEATSALDSITEESVFRAITEIAKTKTVLMIAHRISTVRACDTIFVMDKGRVVGQGGYHELLEDSDLFKALAQLNLYDDPVFSGPSS